MNPNEAPKTCGSCKCGHHVIGPIAIILIGLAFLFSNLGWITGSVLGIIWPILIIIWGAGKLCKCCGKCCDKKQQ